MSQPPAGGYPPPDQPVPPGSYPPPAQPGPPPPGPGGYPPPPPGGYPPPPAGGYPPPPAGAPGGYPPPAGGYPPQGPGGYPPPGPGGYPPPPGRPAGGFDPSKIAIGDWLVLGGGVLYLIFSFLTWQYRLPTVTATFYDYGVLRNGWGSFYIIGTLLLVAVLVVRALQLFVPQAGLQRTVKPEFVAYGALAGALVVLISVIVILFSSGFMYAGAWLALIAALGMAYGTLLSAQTAGARLPFKVPGPA